MTFLEEDLLRMDYGFMKGMIGGCRCQGKEIDDNTEVILRVIASAMKKKIKMVVKKDM
jgi:hypothetical protein